MADSAEPKGRYPRQEVSEGQVHGYIGDVDVYDPPEQEPGYSNASTKPAGKSKTTHTDQSIEDVTPKEKPIVGATGLVGGTVDNVKAPT